MAFSRARAKVENGDVRGWRGRSTYLLLAEQAWLPVGVDAGVSDQRSRKVRAKV